MTAYVLRLAELDQSRIEDAGGKGANLGELTRVPGVAVPSGFCVTTHAYAEVVRAREEVTCPLAELSRRGAVIARAYGLTGGCRRRKCHSVDCRRTAHPGERHRRLCRIVVKMICRNILRIVVDLLL